MSRLACVSNGHYTLLTSCNNLYLSTAKSRVQKHARRRCKVQPSNAKINLPHFKTFIRGPLTLRESLSNQVQRLKKYFPFVYMRSFYESETKEGFTKASKMKLYKFTYIETKKFGIDCSIQRVIFKINDCESLQRSRYFMR